MKIAAISLLVVLNIVACCLASTSDCKYTSSDGKTKYDLSSLKKSYTWTQTVINTAGNIYTNADFSQTANLTFTVGVCQNADTSDTCKGPGAVFMLDATTKKCIVLGSLNVSVFQPNPYQDGVYIDYYNGDKVGETIYDYDARVYFVCKDGTEIDGPVFEHLKDTNQAHFHVFTKYACKPKQ